MNQETADQILGNVLSGEFGKRGEVYVATQVFLVLCILFGGLPIFGDFLNLLCGPHAVLMAIGVGVCALGFIDMGASCLPGQFLLEMISLPMASIPRFVIPFIQDCSPLWRVSVLPLDRLHVSC